MRRLRGRRATRPRGWVTSGRCSECPETGARHQRPVARGPAPQAAAPGPGGLSLAWKQRRGLGPRLLSLRPRRAGARPPGREGAGPSRWEKSVPQGEGPEPCGWGAMGNTARHAVRVRLSLQKPSGQRQRRTAPCPPAAWKAAAKVSVTPAPAQHPSSDTVRGLGVWSPREQ